MDVEQILEEVKKLPELDLATLLDGLQKHLVKEKMSHLIDSVLDDDKMRDLVNERDELSEEVTALENQNRDLRDWRDKIRKTFKEILA